LTVAQQHAREGANLWERDPDRCCHLRKVEPLIRALEPYQAWVSGVRREQSPSRAGLPKVVRSERYSVAKLHPLADWTEDDVWRYIAGNDIPCNPLHDAGYRSIRLHPVHAADGTRRGGARGTLGGIGQGRMRLAPRESANLRPRRIDLL
jgi:phosphoadenosine phosphosulfate reductase